MHGNSVFGTLEGKNPRSRLRCRWEVITETDLKEKWYEMNSNDWGWCPLADFCDHGNETSGPIKGGEFLERLNYCQFLKQVSPLTSQYRLHQCFSTAGPRQIVTGPKKFTTNGIFFL
jgi:hypothetical protein